MLYVYLWAVAPSVLRPSSECRLRCVPGGVRGGAGRGAVRGGVGGQYGGHATCGRTAHTHSRHPSLGCLRVVTLSINCLQHCIAIATSVNLLPLDALLLRPHYAYSWVGSDWTRIGPSQTCARSGVSGPQASRFQGSRSVRTG